VLRARGSRLARTMSYSREAFVVKKGRSSGIQGSMSRATDSGPADRGSTRGPRFYRLGLGIKVCNSPGSAVKPLSGVCERSSLVRDPPHEPEIASRSASVTPRHPEMSSLSRFVSFVSSIRHSVLSCVDLERDTLTSVELAAARDLRTDITSTQGHYVLGVFVIVSVLV